MPSQLNVRERTNLNFIQIVLALNKLTYVIENKPDKDELSPQK